MRLCVEVLNPRGAGPKQLCVEVLNPSGRAYDQAAVELSLLADGVAA